MPCPECDEDDPLLAAHDALNAALDRRDDEKRRAHTLLTGVGSAFFGMVLQELGRKPRDGVSSFVDKLPPEALAKLREGLLTIAEMMKPSGPSPQPQAQTGVGHEGSGMNPISIDEIAARGKAEGCPPPLGHESWDAWAAFVKASAEPAAPMPSACNPAPAPYGGPPNSDGA